MEESPYADIDKTKDFLNTLEEDGQIWAIGIFDPGEKTIHLMKADEWPEHQQKVIAELNKIGFSVDKIEAL